jgi:DNA topoisomerase I
VTFKFRAKHKVQVRTSVVDDELAAAIKELVAQPGGARIFRYGYNGDSCNLTGAVLNDYIREHMGEEFTAKDFRTWGGTMLAAQQLRSVGPASSKREAERNIVGVIDTVAERLGNTRAVCRKYYVHPGLLTAYLDGRVAPAAAAKPVKPARSAKPTPALRREEVAVLQLLQEVLSP